LVGSGVRGHILISEKKTPSTPEGMAVAYSSLVVMAMLPIIFGSIRSVKLHKLKKVGGCNPVESRGLTFISCSPRARRRTR